MRKRKIDCKLISGLKCTELKHTIEHAVIIAEGNTLTANCLPRTFRKEVFEEEGYNAT